MMGVMSYARTRATTRAEVGCVRRFAVSVLTEAAHGLARASVRLLPSNHPYRVFREEVLAATDDAHRYALGHEWHDAHSLAKLAIGLLVLVVAGVVAAAFVFDAVGIHHVIRHHDLFGRRFRGRP